MQTQNWLGNGLMVGLTTVVVGGATAALAPGNVAAILTGSTTGAIAGSAIATTRRNQELLRLRTTLQNTKARSTQSQYQFDRTQANNGQTVAERQLAAVQGRVAELQNRLQDSQQREAALFNQLREAAAEVEALKIQAQVVQTEAVHLWEEMEEPQPLEDGTETEEADEEQPAASDLASTRPFDLGASHPEEVIAWFALQQVRVERYHESNPPVDKLFNKHAIALGENYPLLAPLLSQFKWAIAKGRGIQHHLQNASQEERSCRRKFCQDLLSDTFLAAYRCSKSSRKIIHATIQDNEQIRSFFNGMWFERYVCYKICHLIQELGKRCAYLLNPEVTFANGDRFELDLVLLVEGQPLLIECKTGKNFTSYLKQFSDHRRRLSIAPDRAVLVILDFEDEQTEQLSHLWKFTVASPNNFLPLIRAALS